MRRDDFGGDRRVRFGWSGKKMLGAVDNCKKRLNNDKYTLIICWIGTLKGLAKPRFFARGFRFFFSHIWSFAFK